MKLSVYCTLLGLMLLCGCQPKRSYCGAKFEKKDQVLIGAGQNSTDDFMSFVEALLKEVKPSIYMDYFDVYDPKLDLYFDTLQMKLAKIPWQVVPQLGMNLVGDNSNPLDSLVAAGYYDANLSIIIRRLKELNCPVFMRIGYEFNGSWNRYTPAYYIETFRKVSTLLKEQQVNNVALVWCAEGGEINADYMKFYPGDEYVDWWGIDFFSASDFKNPYALLFTKDAANHSKPIMIGETTPRYTTTMKGKESWDEWFVSFFDYIDNNPNVKAFCYINWDWVKYAKVYGTNWGDWGDCRIEKNLYISTKMKEVLKSNIYYKAK